MLNLLLGDVNLLGALVLIRSLMNISVMTVLLICVGIISKHSLPPQYPLGTSIPSKGNPPGLNHNWNSKMRNFAFKNYDFIKKTGLSLTSIFAIPSVCVCARILIKIGLSNFSSDVLSHLILRTALYCFIHWGKKYNLLQLFCCKLLNQ